MKTVHEVSQCAGVSVRTLHYYDQIGLLFPSEVTDAGYRLYDDTAISRLQQIMFYRELGFALKDIRDILASDSFDEADALTKHRKLLLMKRERLDALIGLVDRILKGEKTMSFTEFDETQIEAQRRAYAKEARERWGNTDAYAQSEQKTAQYSKQQWEAIHNEAAEMYRQFASHMNEGAGSAGAQQAVRQWQAYITKYFYTCTNDILAGLGQMYTADERFAKNIDAHAPGLAEFMSEAIRIYCLN